MYVITGAGGFLGSYLIKTILEKTDEIILACASTEKIFGYGNERVFLMKGDLRDDEYLSAVADRINTSENVKLIHTAACHNIDYVAEHPEEAFFMNVTIAQRLLDRIDKCDKLLFTSSDTVYGEGGKHSFTEDDELNPISVYGEQKIAGEKVFIKKGGTALRLPLMFSKSLSPSKKHFCDMVCDNLINKRETKLVTGSVRSTLDYGTVAEIIIELSMCPNLPEVLNIGSDVPLSKYELGLQLAECIGADAGYLVPVESLGTFAEGAKRADSTILSNKKLKSILDRNEIKIKL